MHHDLLVELATANSHLISPSQLLLTNGIRKLSRRANAESDLLGLLLCHPLLLELFHLLVPLEEGGVIEVLRGECRAGLVVGKKSFLEIICTFLGDACSEHLGLFVVSFQVGFLILVDVEADGEPVFDDVQVSGV